MTLAGFLMPCLIRVDLKVNFSPMAVRNFIGTFPPLYMHEASAKDLAQGSRLKIWLKMPGVKEEL